MELDLAESGERDGGAGQGGEVVRSERSDGVAQVAAAARVALDRLSVRERQILLFRWEGKKSHREIAERLGVPERTAVVRLERAIRRFLEDVTVRLP